MRKLAQKDDAQLKENAERAEQNAEAGEATDSVLITPEARRKAKMRQVSDFRQAKVDDVRARLESGTLVTPDTLKNGTKKMLDSLFSGGL